MQKLKLQGQEVWPKIDVIRYISFQVFNYTTCTWFELNVEIPFTHSAGTIVAIVVSLVSSVAVLVVGVLIGIYIWNNRYVNNKRRGKLKTLPFNSLLVQVPRT